MFAFVAYQHRLASHSENNSGWMDQQQIAKRMLGRMSMVVRLVAPVALGTAVAPATSGSSLGIDA